RRLGLWDPRAHALEPHLCLPAPGQGALAVQVRADDPVARQAVELIDDLEVRLAVIAERELLARLGGGCHVPIGALAQWHGEAGQRHLRLQASVADPDGARLLTAAAARALAALLPGGPASATARPPPPADPGPRRAALAAARAPPRSLPQRAAEALRPPGRPRPP